MAATETSETATEAAMHWLSDEEARAEFEAQARSRLGISGDEFLRRWDAGEYRNVFDDEDHLGVLLVASLIPLVRP
jgi:hypothetical protein